jgi:tetratricopeptide (TPR) repeat protein
MQELAKYWRNLLKINKKRYSMDPYLKYDETIKDKKTLLAFYKSVTHLLIEGYFENRELAMKFAVKNKELHESILGKNTEETALAYNLAGIVYCYKASIKTKDDLLAGFRFHRAASEIRDELYGEDNEQIAFSYHMLASAAMHVKTAMKGALEYEKMALEIRLNLYGEKHRLVAATYNNIALCYEHLDEREKAAEYFEKSIAVYEETLGKNNHHTAGTCHNAADCYFELGDYEKSLSFNKRALEIYEKMFPEDDDFLLSKHENVGANYYQLGYYKEALNHFEKIAKYDNNKLIREYIGKCRKKLGNA